VGAFGRVLPAGGALVEDPLGRLLDFEEGREDFEDVAATVAARASRAAPRGAAPFESSRLRSSQALAYCFMLDGGTSFPYSSVSFTPDPDHHHD
jgi:hypothetical protein